MRSAVRRKIANSTLDASIHQTFDAAQDFDSSTGIGYTRLMPYFRALLIVTMTLALAPSSAHAWGERGHHLICQVATSLVKEKALREYLVGKGHLMGHVCNIPDIAWGARGKRTPETDSAHFLNPERFKEIAFADMPTDLAQLARLTHQTPQQLATTLGTGWWRVDQFFRRAVKDAKRAGAAGRPTQPKVQKDQAHPYNSAIFDMVVNLGLMGHFVGDLAQPYHNTLDYDGAEAGHGGIHVFYESLLVDALGLDLDDEIARVAATLPPEERGGGCTATSTAEKPDVLCQAKSISLVARKELTTIQELDRLIPPGETDTQDRSELESLPRGGKTHSKPKRRPAAEAAQDFKPLITRQLARAAATLAALWDEAYVAAGRPDLPDYFSSRYPISPEVVPLDYLK